MLRHALLRTTPLLAAVLFATCVTARAAEPDRAPSPAPSPSASPSPTPAPSMQWRSIGPSISGGRVATVAGTDLDPALFYAGAAGGGVWRSTNGGIDWRPVFETAGAQSIVAIALAPHDKNDVWVGTGEPWPRNDVIPGDGIYHSTDGGKTWARRGLTQTSQIARIQDHPRDLRGLREPAARPGLAAVGRVVDAVARDHVVARPRLAGADPHVVLVVRCDRDRAARQERRVGRHRRAVAAQRRDPGRRHLPLDRRGQDLGAPRAHADLAARAGDPGSARPEARARRRARRSVPRQRGARRVPQHRRRRDVDEDAVLRPGGRRVRSRGRSEESRRAVRGDV